MSRRKVDPNGEQAFERWYCEPPFRPSDLTSCQRRLWAPSKMCVRNMIKGLQWSIQRNAKNKTESAYGVSPFDSIYLLSEVINFPQATFLRQAVSVTKSELHQLRNL